MEIPVEIVVKYERYVTFETMAEASRLLNFAVREASERFLTAEFGDQLPPPVIADFLDYIRRNSEQAVWIGEVASLESANLKGLIIGFGMGILTSLGYAFGGDVIEQSKYRDQIVHAHEQVVENAAKYMDIFIDFLLASIDRLGSIFPERMSIKSDWNGEILRVAIRPREAQLDIGRYRDKSRIER